MCNHSFCSHAKIRKCHHQISTNKVIIWMYTKKKEPLLCLIKEQYRNYDPIKDYLTDSDEGCYQKSLSRILKSRGFKDFNIFEIFSSFPRVEKYQNSMVFIGLYKNIPLPLIKKNMKDSFYENIDLFSLYGESFNKKKICLSLLSSEILNKSIEEDWINFYKI